MMNGEQARKPIVSILMPVYNAEKFLRPAVASILNQRKIFDYEVIIVDDGSTDSSIDILMEMADERFLILRRKQNRGIAASLNAGLQRCRAELVARMDADDIMHPERLVTQMEFLRQHPPIVVCGTYFDYIDEEGKHTGAPIKFPVQPDDVRKAFKNFTALGHPTVMFRRTVLQHFAPEGYPEKYTPADDLGLWMTLLSKGVLMANIPQVLLHYRRHEGQVDNRLSGVQKEKAAQVHRDLGYLVWPEEVQKAKPKRKVSIKKKE